MKNLKNKKMIIVLLIIILVILFLIFLKVLSSNNNVYGDRCSDQNNYKLSNNTINKAKETIKTIDNVDSIDIYTKLCTVKIMVNLKEDVDLNKVKKMSEELLASFKEKELKYYDFSLYVTSDNENSEIYPINVTKHNSKDAFSW